MDITPDTSLVEKLGAVGYSTEEAIAELVDNAIDARIPGSVEHVEILLDFKLGKIVVRDDGVGMDRDGLADAMTVAKSSKKAGQLGKFGIGLKSACSALGRTFEIRTSSKGSPTEYLTKYDADGPARSGGRDWSTPVEERDLGSDDDWHGTEVTITRPRMPLYPSQVGKFRARFGTRYAAYLDGGGVKIRMNTKYCTPVFPDVEPGSRVILSLNLPGGRRVGGYIELLKIRSIRGHYGMDLYKHGRLIKTYEKFGKLNHPEVARISGRLDMDDVPVNFYKNGFLEESQLYNEVKIAFENDSCVKDMCNKSRTKRDAPKSATSVFNHMLGDTEIPGGIPARVSSMKALKVLNQKEPIKVNVDGKPMTISIQHDVEDPAYYMMDNPGRHVDINTASPVFGLARNPIFLAGMIAVEADLADKDPGVRKFLNARNEKLEALAKKFSSGTRVSGVKKEPDLQPSGYGIAKDLAIMYDFLKGVRSDRFQFTALSTLTPYMHYLRNRMVYALYVRAGDADDVADLLRGEFDQFAFIVDPDAGAMRAILSVPNANMIMVVRGYGSLRGPEVAGPEKALVDLLSECKTYGLPLDSTDLRRIFKSMDARGLLNVAKLRTCARAVKRGSQIEPIIRGAA